MLGNFNVLANLPLIILGVLFFIVFVLFIWAGIALLRARADAEKAQKGRKLLMNALWSFLGLLLIVLIYYSVTALLRSGQALIPQQATGEFPSTPSTGFPPPPTYITIDGKNFNGPYPVSQHSQISQPAIYCILCKSATAYTVVGMEQAQKINLLQSPQAGCWMSQCPGGLSNLYVAILWTPKQNYADPQELSAIASQLKAGTNPSCPRPSPTPTPQ